MIACKENYRKLERYNYNNNNLKYLTTKTIDECMNICSSLVRLLLILNSKYIYFGTHYFISIFIGKKEV